MVIDNSLALSASTSEIRGACLSDRDIQIALSALDSIQYRYIWQDMTDSEWDSFESDIAGTIQRIMSLDSCAGGGSLTKIAAKAKNTIGQAKNGASTVIQFNIADYDYDSMIDLIGADDEITVNSSGLYLISANIDFVNTGVNVQQRSTEVWINGSLFQQTNSNDDKEYVAECQVQCELSIGDYLQLKFTTSGTVGIDNASFAVVRLYE